MIRPATAADVDALARIERAAVELFRDDEVYAAFAATPTSIEDHLVAITADKVWVYELDGHVVGFIAIDVRDGEGYLEEVDVDPAFGRRGIGQALVEHVVALTRLRGLKSIALSTLRDVPWNAPLYARLGFVETMELTPALEAVQAHETELGFPMARRVIMRRVI